MKLQDNSIALRCRQCSALFASHPNGITRDPCPECSSEYVSRLPRYATTAQDAAALFRHVATNVADVDDELRVKLLRMAARCELEVTAPEDGH
jgi:hypothetical protein